MASTKLAGTFEAWRVTVSVEIEKLEETLVRCEELGLQPKLSCYREEDKSILFSVVVPSDVCENLIFDFVVGRLGLPESAYVTASKIALICPPETNEPYRIGDMVGVCQCCRTEVGLIKTFPCCESSDPIYVVSWHEIRGGGAMCPGNATLPFVETIRPKTK